MTKTQAWQASYYVKDSSPGVSCTECHVTPLLGILLRISQCLGIAPVRLQRSRGNSLLEMSPELVVFQRLVMVLSSITVVIGTGYDFMSNEHVRVGTAIFTAALWITEVCLTMSICLTRVITAPGTMNRLIILLKQINKITHGLNHGACKVSCPKFGKVKLLSYIFFVFLVNIFEIFSLLNHENRLIATLYTCFYYQNVSVQLIKLELALVMAEVTSSVTQLNDQLERLIQSISQNADGVVNSKYGYLTIRQLAHYYKQFCDMVKKIDKDTGPILFLGFMLMFLNFLITPYHLMIGIVLHREVDFIIMQSCWAISHFVSLFVMVEPCHWMQDQMDRTRYLLSRLARRSADGDERFVKELDIFIRQVQIKDAVIAPMGVFTVSRSLVASIIGSVTTYLAIIIQMHGDVSEVL